LKEEIDEQNRQKYKKKKRINSNDVNERNRFTNVNDDKVNVENNKHELENNNINNKNKNNVTKLNKKNASPVKKQLNNKNINKLPKWAMTAEQDDVDLDDEVQELLDFTNNLDYDDVVNDIEVKAALKTLKQRIDSIKKENEDNQRKKEKDLQIKMSKESDAKKKTIDMNDDNNRSELRSIRSEGQKSIAESRAEDRMDEIKSKIDKNEKKEFDTSSRVGDNVAADE